MGMGKRDALPRENGGREKPRGHRPAAGRPQPAPGAELLWGLIPEMEGAAGRTQSRHGHGP